ncbi:hypothetical protein S7335_747 [Synechococcus sp. PCC 7335]|uniref:CHASE2 domain-containing protein n=1 Tax=Synechococcus sp. (strain ATCC 29403 / PCC 7335) TaxID=91464 RepID=UPI00017EE490|nr:CHASE2 domain-containing protein [Synechococcus sp. PCC 7335]EDX83567.1 hypothetical protein S7335_747 [Synechococcus sp. PCC 7335]
MWSKIRAFVHRTRSVYVVATTVAFAVIAGDALSLFSTVEWEIRDSFFRFRPVESVDPNIVVVTIDEQDIQAAGDWPVPDALLAELLQKINQHSPRAVGLDIYRDLPEDPGHEALVNTFQSMPNLIGVEKIFGNRVNPPPALEERDQVGLADLVLDGDRKIRRALLTGTDDQEDSQIKAGLATRVALKYLETEGIELTPVDTERQQFLLGKASFLPLRPNEAGYSKQTLGGYQILMNWRGRADAFITVSMADVLSNQVEPDVMQDRMVFIGSTATSINDLFETPYNSLHNSDQGVMAGVFIHANIASQLTQSALTGRRGISGLSRLQQAVGILIWSLLGALSSWTISSKQRSQQQYHFHRNVLLNALLTVFCMSGLLFGGAYLAFLQGWLLPVAAPFLAFLMSGVITTNVYRQQALQATNSELQLALDELQQSKLQLVQNEKMSALGNLVAGVAHEINNPIGFLSGSISNAEGYFQDLKEHIEVYQTEYSQPTEKVQDHAEEIDLDYIYTDFPKLLGSMEDAMDRIIAISKSLRSFSRADTKDKVSADLHEGLDSTLLILKYRLKANEQRPAIEVVKDYGDLPLVDCFLGQLNQVFMNLLANAIDIFDEAAQQLSFEALKERSQTITIKTALRAERNAVEICIGDNGKGMSEAVKEKIFDHLFTTKAVGKGTGLGLSIARQIVTEAHGGNLSVQSELGKGTEFTIQLPL